MSDPVFFVPSRRFTALEIANLTGARARRLQPMPRSAISDHRSRHRRRQRTRWSSSKASATPASLQTSCALLPCFARRTSRDQVPSGIAVLVTPRPQAAFAQIGRLLFPAAASPRPMTGETGISPRAYVDPAAHLEAGVIVEAGAVIGPDVAIGTGTIIAPNAVIGQYCQIGRDCYIGPNAASSAR